ncbi:MAG: hypothetical protein ABSH42_10715 [Bryobacteraceae bacterium]|jgi:hypothetical protein
MKALTTVIATLAALACTAMLAISQSSTTVHANSPFTGTWEGKLNDLPAIGLKIDDSGGKIGGTIVFYFQERPDANSRWRVTAEYPVPLLMPRVEGKTLTFEVLHHKCHDCAELGPNAKFRVEVAGPDELRLWKLDDRQTGKDPGPGAKLTRQAGPAASGALPASSPFAGTWEGKLNGPGIDLKIGEAGGTISGTVVFYVQERDNAGSLMRVTAEDSVPLLAPHIEAKTLLFEVQPPCHACAEPSPNVRFRIELAGPDVLRLWKLGDPQTSEDPAPGVKLTRRIEPAALRDPAEQQGPLVSVGLRLAVDWGGTPAFFREFRLTLP